MSDRCECCGAGLVADGAATICSSYERTFCLSCGEAMTGRCSNGGGEPVPRPRRALEASRA